MFEFIGPDRPVPARRIAGPLSFVLHAIAGTSVILAALWRVGEPGEPPVILPPVVLSELPQVVRRILPAVPSSGADRRPPGSHPAAAPRPISEPENPQALPPDQNLSIGLNAVPETIPPDAATASGSGTGGELVPGSPCRAGDDCGGGPISIGGDVVSPVALSRPSPAYPEPMRHLKAEGAVLLRAVIGADGAVEDLHVVRADSPLFAEAAVAAVSRWRYSPATLNGRPVRVFLDVSVNFRLQ